MVEPRLEHFAKKLKIDNLIETSAYSQKLKMYYVV